MNPISGAIADDFTGALDSQRTSCDLHLVCRRYQSDVISINLSVLIILLVYAAQSRRKALGAAAWARRSQRRVGFYGEGVPVRALSRFAVAGSLAVTAVFVTAWASAGGLRAVADPCPDVEVVFARGTFEPAGIGGTGQAFVDALRARLGTKAVEVHPVDYPATLDFARAADGVVDASGEVQHVAGACPRTKVVLGGYSQGAAVAGYVTAAAVPAGYTLPSGITGPMPSAVANHVVAVVLFGKPSDRFLSMIDNTAPPINIGPLYQSKTIDLCVVDDPVCSLSGTDRGAHNLYAVNGMVDQAVDFVAHRV